MNILIAIVSIIIFIGGLLLMGYAFDTPGLELIMFLGGILAVTFSVLIPTQLLNRPER
ncbi:hypothetical protein [Ruicaihuangia caeni]|uniref:Uncharacterized protein n=1 Tax=Ruicaihuangia caeni TaxID=3042517 RepID=A0AAW6T1Q7_9MICO|nr:hypothetical protein [Klugiella sp. YN-L-19]MDI2097746.1 hypothetical protein [Klugiella sp. YN-L-19]